MLDRIADTLLPGFDIIQWWQDHAQFSHAERLARFFQEVLLAEIKQRIVIFIDEIDTTLSLDFSDDFFGVIRSLYASRVSAPEFRRLSFVLIGVANPNDLISDPNRTPFNIGLHIELDSFTFEQALPLTREFNLPEAEAAQVLKWILRWTGGHPFLTQRLCYELAEKGRDHWTEAELDQLVDDTFFGQNSWKDSNLSALRDLLTRRAPKGFEDNVLITYRQIRRGWNPVADEERSLAKSHLKLAGIVRRDEHGRLRIYNPIYQRVFDKRWIKEHLPVNWMKRLVYTGAVVVIMVLLNIPMSIYAWSQRSKAIRALSLESEARVSAVQSQVIAETKTEETERSKLIAEQNESVARKAQITADLARRDADEQRRRANKRAAEAHRDKGIAEESVLTVKEQRNLALSGELTANSKSLLRINPELSFRLAYEAYKRAPTELATGALRESLTQSFLHAELRGHDNAVYSASFSSDSKRIITSGADRTAIVYPWLMFAPLNEVLELANRHVFQKWTSEEQEKYFHESPVKAVVKKSKH